MLRANSWEIFLEFTSWSDELGGTWELFLDLGVRGEVNY